MRFRAFDVWLCTDRDVTEKTARTKIRAVGIDTLYTGRLCKGGIRMVLHKQTVLRLRKRKGKALKPSGFKAFSVAERMGFEPM